MFRSDMKYVATTKTNNEESCTIVAFNIVFYPIHSNCLPLLVPHCFGLKPSTYVLLKIKKTMDLCFSNDMMRQIFKKKKKEIFMQM